MKKTQKRLGNKGFSLVELIVVIAIMAVLVGVLAPTLIRNVENSRKSKDEQNLDTIKEAIQVTLQDENAYSEVVPTTGTKAVVEIGSTSTSCIVSGPFSEELAKNINTSKTKLTSKDYKNNTYQFTIDSNGNVSYAKK